MNRKLLGLVVLVCALSTSSALAANWGSAGCGLGAVVFRDQPGKIQIVAATTNNIISPQTSAITSGTSNCFEDSEREEAALFITVNEDALRKDISRGGGESLQGLSKVLGCSDSDKLVQALRGNFQNIFPTAETSAADVNRSIDLTIQSNSELVKTCKIYG